MLNIYTNVSINFIFMSNLYYMLSSSLIAYFFYFFVKYKLKTNKYFYFLSMIRYYLLISCFISMLVHSVTFLIFLKSLKLNLFLNILNENYGFYSIIFYNKNIFFFNTKLSLDFFGMIFLTLAFTVGLISFLVLDQQFIVENSRFIFVCNLLILTIYIMVCTNNYFIFFLLYEILLIPSFIFVFAASGYKKGVQAAQYFLIWTQIGSFLVFLSFMYIFINSGCMTFNSLKKFYLNNEDCKFVYNLLYVGFGFKIPIWPFHYWITKTHVEAPAGFSVFLSGFLVKSAVYGFYKISSYFPVNMITTSLSVLPLIGVLDSSLKMWSQVDFKKLIAYCTIQEMSLLYLVFLWGDTFSLPGGFMLCITHSLLSSFMFFLVDCLQRRFKSRLVTEISGIITQTPNLGTVIIFMIILYSGIPFSIKFTSELYIFNGFFEASTISFLLILFAANFFGLINFSKIWFNGVYGLSLKNNNSIALDLNIKDSLIIFICFFFSFYWNFLTNFFM